MAEFKPNKKQQEFLTVDNCNVLVSASAGSGKTTTMIQKLIKIINNSLTPITSLLVVTYTNAAASEIKLKLFNELTSLINDTDDIKSKSFLQEQLENINNAEIGTLHSICKKLIVKYFYKLEESPDFSLLSDREEKYFIDVAIKNVFNNHIESGDDSFFELYDCYNTKRNDSTLKNMCLQLYYYKCSKVDYSKWKNEFLNNSYDEDINLNQACNYILEYYQKMFLMYSSQLFGLRKIAIELDLPKYQSYIDSRLQFIDEISKATDFEMVVKIMSQCILPQKPSKSKNATADEIDFDERVDSFNEFFKDSIKVFKENLTSTDINEIKSSIINSKNNVIKLMEIVDEITENYSLLKKSKNSLDFNDLENKMLNLLKNEEVRNNLRNQYKYVFVDEYQDINDKQENILLQLVSNDNYYMIGDVKQSIYAFRQSSPKIFIAKYNEYGFENKNNKLINFNANYRSDRNILEFANCVFDKVITRETIGIDYASDARFVSEKEYDSCNVSLSIINKEEKIQDKEYAEAMVIAKEIDKFINMPRTDGKKYTYGDIAIIIRQRGSFVRTLYEVLSSKQIPVSANVNSEFFNTGEIDLMLSILRVVSNFRNDIAMAVVLKNLFDMTEEELMNISMSREEGSFVDKVLCYSNQDCVLEKINKFFEFVDSSKKSLLTMTIKDYLHSIIENFDIILKLRTSPNGKEKEGNIIEFLRIADNDNYKYNLEKFLEYLEFISKESSLQHLGLEANAVQICTIHYSKGLEYPIVILGGMGKMFQLNKDSGNIIINSKFGIGLKSVDNLNRTLCETVVRSACKIDNRKSELDEEIRLLYVAMTRAKEKLSIVGCYDLSNVMNIKSKRIYSSRNYFDLIFKSIDKSDLYKFQNLRNFIINDGCDYRANVSIYQQDDFNQEQTKENSQIILNAVDENLLNGLEAVLNRKPNTQKTPIKNTVTNILKEETDYENLNFAPKKLDLSDNVENRDYLKLGTAYHSVMQELKFTENKQEIKDLIESLVLSGVIDKDIKKDININQIEKAIDVLKDLILKADVVYREKQFLLSENYNKLIKNSDNNTKVIVQGVIDLVVEIGDKVYLIDYKTNRGITAEQLIEEYKIQLDLYSYAFELATNKHITNKFLYSFYLGQLIEVE